MVLYSLKPQFHALAPKSKNIGKVWILTVTGIIHYFFVKAKIQENIGMSSFIAKYFCIGAIKSAILDFLVSMEFVKLAVKGLEQDPICK